MAKIGDFYTVHPDKWLFSTHGDVVAARLRAESFLSKYGTLDKAEYEIEEFVRQWALRQLLDIYINTLLIGSASKSLLKNR